MGLEEKRRNRKPEYLWKLETGRRSLEIEARRRYRNLKGLYTVRILKKSIFFISFS